MYIRSVKSVFAGFIVICSLVLNVTVAESKSRKASSNLTKLQGSWVGYGKVKGQRSRCDVTISGRSISAKCGNSSGAVSSSGRVRGARKMWAKWRSSDGLYEGISQFRNIRRNSHTMHIHVDGHGSGRLYMKR